MRRFFCQAMKEMPKKITIRESLRLAMIEEMRRDPKVFLIGEEVAQYQGAYKISKGMLEEFGPDRVVDTPITEAGFTGLAVGASLMGLIPIVEFMTWNFALQGIDHIFNSCAKIRYMSGGDLGGGIVFRGLNGPAASVAAQHSQCFASSLSNVPGLIVISPYDCEDSKSLLKAAIRCKNPVAFLENELTYGHSFEVEPKFYDPEHVGTIGKARIMRQGHHITLIAFSRMVGLALEAAKQLEKANVSAEVINLCTIKPLDRKTIIDSVKKTGRVVVIEDGYPFSGVAAEIVSTIVESPAFDYLDAPPERVTAWDIPLPYGNPIEALCLPQVESILKGAKKILQGAKL